MVKTRTNGMIGAIPLKYNTDVVLFRYAEVLLSVAEAINEHREPGTFRRRVRRQDLIRNGSYIATAQAQGKSAQPYDTLFPIPESIILQGRGIIQQNPGY